MRVSQFLVGVALCSSVFAAPQVVTVTTTIYPLINTTSTSSPAGPFQQATSVAPPPAVTVTTTIYPPIATTSTPSRAGPFQQATSITPPPPKFTLPGPRPKSSPRPSAAAPPPAPSSPSPIAGPSSSCGAGRSTCGAGQYCYDANLDKILGTTDVNGLGTCYGSACSASVICPVGQVCIQGRCLNQNLDCGFRGDECPENEPGWRCVGSLLGLAKGYCSYSPKLASF